MSGEDCILHVDDAVVSSDDDDLSAKKSTYLTPQGTRRKRQRLPNAKMMELLPEVIRKNLYVQITKSLQGVLVPRLKFIRKRMPMREDERRAHSTLEPIAPSFLQTVTLFTKWTNLDSMARAASVVLLKKNVVLVHQNDPSELCMYVLVSGTLQSISKGSQSKGCRGLDAVAGRIYDAPAVFRERAFLMMERPAEYLRSTSKCVLWRIFASDLRKIFGMQTEERRASSLGYAIEERRLAIPSLYSMTPAMLKAIPIFSAVQDEYLRLLITKMTPRTLEAGTILSTVARPPEIFFLLAGTVEVTMLADRKTFRLMPGTVHEVIPVLFPKKAVFFTTKTATICDFFTFTRESLRSAISVTEEMTSILRTATIDGTFRACNQQLFRQYLSSMPFLNHHATSEMIDELLMLFSDSVYPPGSTMISASETCSKLIIPVRGTGRITVTGQDLVIGECLGFACLIPHRWMYHVTARDAVESIELSKVQFEIFLKKYGLLERVTNLTLGLLFPLVMQEDFVDAVKMIQDCVNPPTFPVSDRSVYVKENNSNNAASLCSRSSKSAAKLNTDDLPRWPPLDPPSESVVAEMLSQAVRDLAMKPVVVAAVEPPRINLVDRFKHRIAETKRDDVFRLATKKPEQYTKPARRRPEATVLSSHRTTSADDPARLVDGGAEGGVPKDAATQTTLSFIAERDSILREMLGM